MTWSIYAALLGMLFVALSIRTLRLILACEWSGAPIWCIQPLGLILLGGRLVHAYGVSSEAEVVRYRVTGMALTFTRYLLAAAFLLGQAVLARL